MPERRKVFATTQGRFNLLDGGEARPASAVWTPEASARRLALAPGFLGIGTVEPFTQVAVTVALLLAPPAEDGLERWAFVVEGGIALHSGRLLVTPSAEPGRPALTVELTPGVYRARIACDRGEHVPVIPGGTETYHVELWPAEPDEPRVLHSRHAEA
jgi:hypothetical protein